MLRTRLCELLGIEAPVIQAAIWPATSPELVAAVGEAGAIGSLGALFGSAQRVREEIAAVRARTDRPFIVNHVVPQLDEDAFAATLEARPAAVSFALGDPGGLVERAHAAGAKVIHQVHTVGQARAAAALALGAQGVNVGTRFLAAEEASSDPAWREQIVASESEQAVRFEAWSAFFPPAGGGAYDVVPRVLTTPFVERWRGNAAEAAKHAEELRAEVMDVVTRRAAHEIVPFAGQTAGARQGRPRGGGDRAADGRRGRGCPRRAGEDARLTVTPGSRRRSARRSPASSPAA